MSDFSHGIYLRLNTNESKYKLGGKNHFLRSQICISVQLFLPHTLPNCFQGFIFSQIHTMTMHIWYMYMYIYICMCKPKTLSPGDDLNRGSPVLEADAMTTQPRRHPGK
jgi:hypothetical protein